MHNWKALVRARLDPLPVDPARAGDIVDELAQHVADTTRISSRPACRKPRRSSGRWRRSPIARGRWRDRHARIVARGPPRGCNAFALPGPAASGPATWSSIWRATSVSRAAASPRARLRGDRARDAGARHRREHRDLQRAERRAAPPAAVRGSGPARHDRRARPDGIGRQRRLHHVPRLARAQPRVRRHGAHPLVDPDADRRTASPNGSRPCACRRTSSALLGVQAGASAAISPPPRTRPTAGDRVDPQRRPLAAAVRRRSGRDRARRSR